MGTRVELHNPTYKEVLEFLAHDPTDSNPLISGEYTCVSFAAEVNNNAEANGIRAAYARLSSKEWAHVVVAFETVDKGLVFIEPQSDRKVELALGKSYWESAGAVRPVDYDDVVVEIQIVW